MSTGLSTAQGSFNTAMGLWPLVHMRSFEAVSGHKTDDWLVRTVSGLLLTIGLEQLRHASGTEGAASAKRLGIGTAATLAAIDLIYATTGRIRKIYLLDAVFELFLIIAWLRTRETTDPANGKRRND
ncbi:hypothetical protein M1D89_01740 (plasmid) [Arthrobacter sp. D3-18]